MHSDCFPQSNTLFELATSSYKTTQSCILIHSAYSCTSLATTNVNTIQAYSRPAGPSLSSNRLTYDTDRHYITKQNNTGLVEKNDRTLKLPHKYNTYKGAADHKNTPCVLDAVAKYPKLNFKYKPPNQICPDDIPRRLFGSVEEIRATQPRPKSADQPSMWRRRKPKHDSTRPVLNLTNKTCGAYGGGERGAQGSGGET